MISDSFSLVKSSLPLEVRKAAAYGWKLFPIVAGAKSPLVKWGTTEPASSDLDQITRWAMKYPNSSWGCATGSKSGFFAVDTDDMDGWLWAMSKAFQQLIPLRPGRMFLMLTTTTSSSQPGSLSRIVKRKSILELMFGATVD